MKKPAYIVSIMLAVCLYFTYKFTGRSEFAVLSIIALIVAGILRIVHDAVNHSFPWSKTDAQKNKETKSELARREKIIMRQRGKDLKKARKEGRLDEFAEKEAAKRAESDKKYELYQESESETEYVSVKKDVPKSK